MGELKKEYDVSKLELLCYQAGLQFAKDLFAYYLKEIDEDIRETRNIGDIYYKNKGCSLSTVKTLMGPVDYSRHGYEYEYTDKETGEIKKKKTFLLNEKAHFELIGKMSVNVAYAAAHLICEQSYRQVSESLENMTGIVISPQGVWNLIQRLAERLEIKIDGIDQNVPSENTAKKAASVILEEADGIYLSMRGSDRPENGRSREMKVATFYEGSCKMNRSKRTEYKCVNKKYMVGFEEPGEFFEKKEAYLAECYDVQKIKTRLVSYDGAHWIKNMYRAFTSGKVHFQLDTYHRNKALLGLSPSQRAEIHGYFKMHEISKALDALRRFYRETSDEEKKKKILSVYKYYKNNKDGLIPITQRVGVTLPELPDGIEYRSLGTMECSVGNLVARRMKKRKAAWSCRGAKNLAWLIGLKLCGDMKSRIEGLSDDRICLETSAHYNANEVLSAAAIKTISGSGYLPMSSSLPIKDAVYSFTREAIQGLINEGGIQIQ
jgi:hypothetical protein